MRHYPFPQETLAPSVRRTDGAGSIPLRCPDPGLLAAQIVDDLLDARFY